MPLILILTPLLFGLSFLSGMLGLGVAFIAIPVLGLFGYDLINEIQPWALLLNGLTAISAAIAFWKAGMVDKRGALILVDHHDDRRPHRRVAPPVRIRRTSSGGSTSAS